MIDFAVIPTRSVWGVETQHGDTIHLGEAAHRDADTIANALEQGRRGDGVAEVLGLVGNHLAADLQLGHVPVEIHPTQAVDIQHDMAVQDIVDVDHLGHPATSRMDTQCFTAS